MTTHQVKNKNPFESVPKPFNSVGVTPLVLCVYPSWEWTTLSECFLTSKVTHSSGRAQPGVAKM